MSVEIKVDIDRAYLKAQWVYAMTISQRNIKAYINVCYNTLISWNLGNKTFAHQMWHQDLLKHASLKRVNRISLFAYRKHLQYQCFYVHCTLYQKTILSFSNVDEGTAVVIHLARVQQIFFSRQKPNSVFRLRYFNTITFTYLKLWYFLQMAVNVFISLYI